MGAPPAALSHQVRSEIRATDHRECHLVWLHAASLKLGTPYAEESRRNGRAYVQNVDRRVGVGHATAPLVLRHAWR